jgi:hypothetical protein
MPVFSTGSDNANGRYALPDGFLASFIVVPLVTYLICLAVVWTLGFNTTDRRRALRMIWRVNDSIWHYCFRLKRRLTGRR